jgi:hypothetical protein
MVALPSLTPVTSGARGNELISTVATEESEDDHEKREECSNVVYRTAPS